MVIARDSVRNKNQPRAVKFSAPSSAVSANSDLRRLVHFRIGKRLVLALVPSPSSEYSHPIIERLFEIGSKSILDRCLHWMSRDLRAGRDPGQEIFDGFAVTSHVGVIHKTQKTHNAFALANHSAMQLELNILSVRTAHVCVEMNAV